MDIKLRKAILQDSKMILKWRNESTTIPWMGSTRALSFDEHDCWFRKVIEDPNLLFLIIEVDSEPVGQIHYIVSYDRLDNYAKVSINITHKMQRKGIASIAFSKGNELVREIGFASKIIAHVQQDNIGSIKAMKNAGYESAGTIKTHGVEHLVMSYKVEQKT